MSSEFDKVGLGRVLAATDVAYFEAAAENTPRLGGVLSHIQGFPGLSLACVLHSLAVTDDLDSWIQQLEACIAAKGSRWVRFYLQEVSEDYRDRLQAKGYRELVELGFVTRLGDIDGSSLVLKRCQTENQWRQYTRISLESGDGPDGFDMVGGSYARVSRLKVDAGYMIPYLAFLRDRAVGFVNLSLQGQFARCKNLLVHPEFRGRGVGSSIVSSAMTTARDKGARYFGCYAIADEASVELYSGLGMVQITRQSEWSKPIDST